MKILFAPFAKPLRGKVAPNPKDYPWPDALDAMLMTAGHEVVQLGCSGEKEISGTFVKDLQFNEITEILQECDTFISVDSYLQHHAWFIKKRGIVLWGQSDPNIFGHELHINLLKSRKNLREGYRMFDCWESCPVNKDAFVQPDAVLKALGACGA